MKTEKEVERWPDSRVRRWGDEWINRHADGWLDRRKGSIENRWTDSDSDGQNSILIAGDKYTKDRKITYDEEDRQRQVWKQEEGLNQPDNMLSCLTMYISSMYICIYYAYMYNSESNMMIFIFTSFIHMGLCQNSLCNFKPSEVAGLKANHLQGHMVLHSIQNNSTTGQPQCSYHSK